MGPPWLLGSSLEIKSLEHRIDRLSPSLGVRLRLLRKRLRHDMTLSVLRQLVRPGDQVFDIGAYRGVYTLELARLVGARGRVWAVEPFPPNVAAMARAVGRRKSVVVCPWAASDHRGRQALAVPVHRGRHLGALATLGSVGVSTDAVEIDVRPLDDALSDDGHDARGVAFIRCDVVGHEASVLAGAAQTLRTSQPALLVEIEQRHQDSPVQGTFDLLQGHGYEGYFLRSSSLFPLESFDLERDQLSRVPAGFVPYGMPEGYVHYFLFVRPGTELGALAPG